MQLKIVKCPNRKLRKTIKKAVEFYAKELIPSTKIRNNCYLEIIFNKKQDNLGFVGVEGTNSRNLPRWFQMDLKYELPGKDIIETIAHEMVHVKQFIYGELNELSDNLSIWKGRKVNPNKVKYDNHPWETEAYEKEPKLFKKFIELHGKI